VLPDFDHIPQTYRTLKMLLEHLPNEILNGTLGNLHASDFENAALTCKAWFRLLEPSLKHHNDIRRKWHRVMFGDRTGPQRFLGIELSSALQLLVRIAQEPVIALYITHLDLSRMSIALSSIANGNRADLEAGILSTGKPSDMARGLLIECAKGSVHLRDLNIKPEEWLAHVEQCILSTNWDSMSDWAAALLISLLPNLESLSLPPSYLWCRYRPRTPRIIPGTLSTYRELQPCCGHAQCLENQMRESDHIDISFPDVYSLIDMLIARANDESLRGQPLSKLTTLGSEGLENNKRDDQSSIIPFMSLKSLRTVSSYTRNCGRPTNPDWLIRYQPLGTNLEELTLRGVALDAPSSGWLLGAMGSLRAVKLQLVTRFDSGPRNIIPMLVSRLEATCGNHLETLHLTTGVPCRGDWLDDDPIRTMHGFRCLKEIKIFTGFLFRAPDPYISIQIPNKVGPQSCPNLGELLTNSRQTLQRIKVHVGDYEADKICVTRLLQGVEVGGTSFPALQRVKVVFAAKKDSERTTRVTKKTLKAAARTCREKLHLDPKFEIDVKNYSEELSSESETEADSVEG
jgi:hypothetical protein